MPNLYPPQRPYHTEMLSVGDGHHINLELSGNPKGTPALFIHGGPGAGLPDNYRRFFDPEKYLIIGFDQRGCGKSTPFAGLKHNTTADLVNDIEQIRQHLGISAWLLFGGSWGSTLALVYAIQHSHYILGVILRGTFLAREQDRDWFLCPSGGAASLFPEDYQKFAAYSGGAESADDICANYYKVFKHADELTQALALKAWYGWEERISRLVLPQASAIEEHHFHAVKSLALLECHYLKNHCFIAENYILENIEAIADLPGTIVHGRYDLICKSEGAFSLHHKWHNSRLQIVPDAGHSTSEKGIMHALCKATEEFARFARRRS